MTPGQKVDSQLTKLHNACGRLIFMVTKRKLVRVELLSIADVLEQAAKVLREAAQ